MYLLNGSYEAIFEKGEKGKPGKWTYVPKKNVKRNEAVEKKHDGKEQPQYPITNQIELASKERFQANLKDGVLNITRYLNQLT